MVTKGTNKTRRLKKHGYHLQGTANSKASYERAPGRGKTGQNNTLAVEKYGYLALELHWSILPLDNEDSTAHRLRALPPQVFTSALASA
jgi:hypothetical protein